MNTREQIIRQVMADWLGLDADKINPDEDIYSLGGDSLDAIEILMEIEDRFNIEISDEDAEGLDTINKMLAYLEERYGRHQE